jgi:DNA replication factor GINS
MNRDDLYRIWKAEKSEKVLQRLPMQFYAEVRKLLSDCKASSAATGQDRTQKAINEKEFKILQRLSTEIARTRMKKIVDAALSGKGVASEELAQEEAEFAKTVTTHVGDYYSFVDDLVLGGLSTEETAPSRLAEARLEVVRFLSDFPAIIGVDLKTYGPFKSEDIATLPAENASALLSQGVVKQVHFREGTAPTLQTK